MIKLIRDKLGRRIGLGPGDKVRLVASEAEYQTLLLEKLEEEYKELRKELVRRTVNPEKVAEEAGDLVEVIGAITDEFASMSLGCLLEDMKDKRRAKGGFEGGIVLETKE